VGNCWSSSNQH